MTTNRGSQNGLCYVRAMSGGKDRKKGSEKNLS